ncbi:hypothetical protein D3C84_1014950 [compost metagenome]
MQQAIRLVSAMVDDHARGQGLFIEGFETDVQHFADGVFLDYIQLFDVGGGAHRVIADFPYWFCS